MNKKQVFMDKSIFFPAVILTLCIAIPMILSAEYLQSTISGFYQFLKVNFGWAYLLLFIFGGIFIFYVALSPYGNIKLGSADQKPIFNNFNWAGMIIASGYGIGIINWSMIEPTITMALNPLGGNSSAYALEAAITYGFFHWGPFHWVVYLVPCVPIFYFLGVRRVHRQRISECLTPIWGIKNTKGLLGKIFDIFVVMSLIGGISVTLGTAIPLVSGLLAPQIGIQDSFGLQMMILTAITGLIIISTFRSLDKGMKTLSDFNSYISIIMLCIVLIGGPTAYLLNLGTNTLGMLFDLAPRIGSWTDPLLTTQYPQDWTIFYGAWIFAYGPMMGIFITSISIGRTLKEVILGSFLLGSMASFLFFVIMGGFAVNLQYTGEFNVYSYYLEHGVAASVYQILSRLPLSAILKPSYLIVASVFLTTTIDASTRVLASMTTKEMQADQEPSTISRLVWCVVLATLVLGVLLVGGIHIIQVLAVASTIPMLFICLLTCIATLKALKQDFPELTKHSEYIYKAKD